jgi:hypothetical protein
MRSKVQLVVCTEDGQEDTVHEMMVLDKACQRIEHLGLTRAEAKQSLAALQQCLVDQQTSAFVVAHAQCEHWGYGSQDQRVPSAHLPHPVWHGYPHQSTPLSLSWSAAQDHHLPTAERPADRRGRPRATVHGEEVALVGVLRPDPQELDALLKACLRSSHDGKSSRRFVPLHGQKAEEWALSLFAMPQF